MGVGRRGLLPSKVLGVFLSFISGTGSSCACGLRTVGGRRQVARSCLRGLRLRKLGYERHDGVTARLITGHRTEHRCGSSMRRLTPVIRFFRSPRGHGLVGGVTRLLKRMQGIRGCRGGHLCMPGMVPNRIVGARHALRRMSWLRRGLYLAGSFLRVYLALATATD